MNLYRYAGDQPTVQMDPLGLIPPNWHRTHARHQPVPPTDAERRQARKAGSYALKAIAVAAVATQTPTGRAFGFVAGVAGEIIGNGPGMDPDGDNDNDGVLDSRDPDDDNDLLPDALDPSPLVPCRPTHGECYTPAPPAPLEFIPPNSCEE